MDRVQVLKQESAAGGGSADDERPWPVPIQSQEDAVEAAGYYVQSATERDELVYLKRDSSGNLLFKDKNTSQTTLSELASGGGGGGGGISVATHEALNSLVHALARTCYTEITRTSGQVTNVTTWTTSSKTQKVREDQISRSSGAVSQIVRLQYDTSGTLAKTVTSVITRSNGAVASIQDTES